MEYSNFGKAVRSIQFLREIKATKNMSDSSPNALL